jgi:hypothetical protein
MLDNGDVDVCLIEAFVHRRAIDGVIKEGGVMLVWGIY